MEGGHWSFDNFPLILHRLELGENPKMVPLNKLPFWVHIHNIPHGSFMEKVGVYLGNFIETFLEYDVSNLGVAWKPYMRIRVERNADLPLKRLKCVKLANRVVTQVDFKYERLHTFCFICGKLGHLEQFCEVSYSSGQTDISRGWGTFLKVLDRHNNVAEESRWLKTEGGSVRN
ncbi:hypothetical protein ACS0TY_026993 [Phlomoides rotata]